MLFKSNRFPIYSSGISQINMRFRTGASSSTSTTMEVGRSGPPLPPGLIEQLRKEYKQKALAEELKKQEALSPTRKRGAENSQREEQRNKKIKRDTDAASSSDASAVSFTSDTLSTPTASSSDTLSTPTASSSDASAATSSSDASVPKRSRLSRWVQNPLSGRAGEQMQSLVESKRQRQIDDQRKREEVLNITDEEIRVDRNAYLRTQYGDRWQDERDYIEKKIKTTTLKYQEYMSRRNPLDNMILLKYPSLRDYLTATIDVYHPNAVEQISDVNQNMSDASDLLDILENKQEERFNKSNVQETMAELKKIQQDTDATSKQEGINILAVKLIMLNRIDDLSSRNVRNKATPDVKALSKQITNVIKDFQNLAEKEVNAQMRVISNFEDTKDKITALNVLADHVTQQPLLNAALQSILESDPKLYLNELLQLQGLVVENINKFDQDKIGMEQGAFQTSIRKNLYGRYVLDESISKEDESNLEVEGIVNPPTDTEIQKDGADERKDEKRRCRYVEDSAKVSTQSCTRKEELDSALAGAEAEVGANSIALGRSGGQKDDADKKGIFQADEKDKTIDSFWEYLFNGNLKMATKYLNDNLQMDPVLKQSLEAYMQSLDQLDVYWDDFFKGDVAQAKIYLEANPQLDLLSKQEIQKYIGFEDLEIEEMLPSLKFLAISLVIDYIDSIGDTFAVFSFKRLMQNLKLHPSLKESDVDWKELEYRVLQYLTSKQFKMLKDTKQKIMWGPSVDDEIRKIIDVEKIVTTATLATLVESALQEHDKTRMTEMIDANVAELLESKEDEDKKPAVSHAALSIKEDRLNALQILTKAWVDIDESDIEESEESDIEKSDIEKSDIEESDIEESHIEESDIERLSISLSSDANKKIVWLVSLQAEQVDILFLKAVQQMRVDQNVQFDDLSFALSVYQLKSRLLGMTVNNYNSTIVNILQVLEELPPYVLVENETWTDLRKTLEYKADDRLGMSDILDSLEFADLPQFNVTIFKNQTSNPPLSIEVSIRDQLKLFLQMFQNLPLFDATLEKIRTSLVDATLNQMKGFTTFQKQVQETYKSVQPQIFEDDTDQSDTESSPAYVVPNAIPVAIATTYIDEAVDMEIDEATLQVSPNNEVKSSK